MAAVMLLTTGTQAFAGSSLEDALNKVNLYVKQDKGAQLLTWKGVIDAKNFAPAVIVYRAEDGKEYPAFCANPNRPGVEDISAKKYDVDADRLDSDPAVWGVITNGYPYVMGEKEWQKKECGKNIKKAGDVGIVRDCQKKQKRIVILDGLEKKEKKA